MIKGFIFMHQMKTFVITGETLVTEALTLDPGGSGFIITGSIFVTAGSSFIITGYTFVIAGLVFKTTGLSFGTAGLNFAYGGFSLAIAEAVFVNKGFLATDEHGQARTGTRRIGDGCLVVSSE
jgi:hypothetical protein